jgi:basic amino acid/polyamine antiporter, APA family
LDVTEEAYIHIIEGWDDRCTEVEGSTRQSDSTRATDLAIQRLPRMERNSVLSRLYQGEVVANVQTDMGASASAVFTRTASGLVRQMSIWDVAMFGLISTGAMYFFAYMYPYPQFLSPGFSATWAILFTIAFSAITYFVYAGVGSAMPRAGGDYLYETRTLGRYGRVFGFSIPWMCQVLAWLLFPITGAYVVNTLGLIPMMHALGLEGAASWLGTAFGGYMVCVAFVIVSYALTVFGLKAYRRAVAWVMVPFIVIGALTLIGVLAVKWNANFPAAFNAYNSGSGITYESIPAIAAKVGVSTSFSLKSTVIWLSVYFGLIPYTMYAAQGMLGEVKSASNFSRLLVAFTIPGFILGFIMLLGPWLLLTHVAGGTWLSQFAIAYASGSIAPNYNPNINVFVEMLATSKVIGVLIALGFIGGGFGVGSAPMMNGARVMMAMSLDGLLPAFFSRVSKRFFTPVAAVTVWSAVVLAIGWWFNYGDTAVVLAVLTTGVATSCLVVGVTMLGSALFPWTAPAIYASAPVKGARLGSVPLITIIGGVGALVVAVVMYWCVTEPALGLTGQVARITLICAFVSGFLIYAVWGLIRRGRGIDVSLTTREVPPE